MTKIIRDGKGRPYVLGATIGQGSFGKVYEAHPEDGKGPSIVAKLPFTEGEIGRGDQTFDAQAAEVCSRLVREQQRSLERMPPHCQVITYGVVDGGGAIPCLLMEALPPSAGTPFQSAHHILDLLHGLSAIARALEPLHEGGVAHGNLKPGNVFLLEDGEVRLTDPAPESPRLLHRAVTTLPGWSARMPPELKASLAGRPQLTSPAIDTFALGKLFYQGILDPDSLKDARYSDALFDGPLTPEYLTPFMDALDARYDRDKGNPHTKELFLRRTQALLARLLSAETAPSPPYRFYKTEELAQRLDELTTLFHPGFEQMGPILLDRPTGQETFVEGEPVVFSLSFKCQGGLKNPDLLNCFIYARDLDREEKVRDLEQEVLPVHDGSRFRCEFTLRGFQAGRFLVRVGMGLKGTPGKPVPRDVLVLIEPAPFDENAITPAPAPAVAATPPALSPSTPDASASADAARMRATGGNRLLSPAPIKPFDPAAPAPLSSQKETPSPKVNKAAGGMSEPGVKPAPASRVTLTPPKPGDGTESSGLMNQGPRSTVKVPEDGQPQGPYHDEFDDDGQGELEHRPPGSITPLLSTPVLMGMAAVILALLFATWAWLG